MYGGLGAIMFGILLVWALVKSGQIENIDNNMKLIAEWVKSQPVSSAFSSNDLGKQEKNNSDD